MERTLVVYIGGTLFYLFINFVFKQRLERQKARSLNAQRNVVSISDNVRKNVLVSLNGPLVNVIRFVILGWWVTIKRAASSCHFCG